MGRKRKPTPTCIDIVRPSKRNPGLSTGQMLSQARSRAAQNAAGVPTNDVYSDLSPGLSEASTTAELSDEEDYECEAGTSGLPGISPHPEPVYPVREYFPEEDDPEEREFPEEHALRPLPRRGHPPIPPHPQPQRMPGRNDKRLFYSMSSLHSGTSKAEMLRNESLHKVLNDGRHQDIRLEEHLEPFYKEILHEYDLQHFFFCPGCSRAIGSRKERCRNRLCQYFNLKCKRSGPRRRVELVLANVKPQLREILSDHFDEIRSVHEYIHHAKVNGTLTARSDVRFFPRYSDRIESQLEFQNRQLQVNLCLSSDGYRPNRLSKHEFWPLYLRVDGINAQDRDAYRNSTVSAVLFTRKSHTLSLSHHFVSRLIEELEDLRVTPMTMPDSAGNLWTIRFSVESGVMDFAGLRDFYKLPRWNAEMGCGKCEIPGRRVGRTRSWANDNVRYGRRNRASILRDGARGVNGVTAITPAMELITPDRFPADSLHVVSEGVAMDRFKDLFDKGRIEELNLSAVDIGALKESVSRVVNHTYCGAYVLLVEDRSSITGSEKQQMCNLLFPLAAGCSPSLQKRVSCVASGMLIGFWWVCRTLEWHQTLTQDKINLVKVVGADVQFLQEQLNPESISMKCHSFLEHSIRDELEEAGSCFAWTAGFSESWHREFQLKHNQSATNCQMDSVKRYLLRKAVYRRFRDCTLVNRHPDYIQLLAETENSHINRFPIKFRVDNIMYVPEKSAIKVNLVTNPNHTPFVRNAFPGSELSSRLMVDGEVYASEIFWSRAKDSQQNLCYVEYRRNNRLVRTFGSVIMFLSDRNGRSELLLRQFETACPFTDLLNRINHYRQPNWLVAHRMLQIVSRNNTFFRKVLREQIVSISSSSIKGHAVSVSLGGNTYMSRVA